MADLAKYKFGNTEINFDDYIYNLEGNVNSYMQDKLKRGVWNEGLAQEFQNSFNRYITAFKDASKNNTGRFSSDSFGNITDNSGEFNNDDLDDFYYNDKGELLDRLSYDALKKRKQKHYKGFAANREVAAFFLRIGEAVAKQSQKPTDKKPSENKYDAAKHGWAKWWGSVKNLDGGENIAPYLELDPYDETAKKRGRTNRAAAAAKWVDEYRNWLGNQNLDYTGNSVDFTELDKRLRDLSSKWGDGKWDNNDLIAAAQAGINEEWLKGFFTEEQNPFKTLAQKDLEAASAKTAEEKAKAEEAEKARRAWIDEEYNKYSSNFSNLLPDVTHYYDREDFGDNDGYSFKHGDRYNDFQSFIESFKGNNELESRYLGGMDQNGRPVFNDLDYLRDFFNNPFTNEAHRALQLLKLQGRLKPLEDGSYYVTNKTDLAKNRVLVYDPELGTLRYTFVGNIPTEWERRKNTRASKNDPNRRYSRYGEGGAIEKLALGSVLGMSDWAKDQLEQHYSEKGKAKGRTADQQASAEQVIGALPGTGEINGASQNNQWEADDYARATGAVADIISAVSAFVPGYGTAVSAITGVGSTALNAYADFSDDSVSFGDALQNVFINLGFDVAGLIPGGNASSAFMKIAKNSGKLISRVAMGWGAFQGYQNFDNIKNSFDKFLSDPTKLEVEDWQNIAQGISVSMGITGAAGRKISQKLQDNGIGNFDLGLPINRKSSTADPNARVAVEMVDPTTGKKEMRVFTGEDAVNLREANGDNAKVKAITDKYDELRDLQLSTGIDRAKLQWVRGDDGWQSPVGFTSGKARIYDLKVGADGKTFIDRGKWRGDVLATDPKVKDSGITIADKQDAEIEGILNPLKAQSDRIDAIIAARSGKESALNTTITAQEGVVNGMKNPDGSAPRTAREVLAEMDAIRQRRGAGDVDYATAEAEQILRGRDFDAAKTAGKARKANLDSEINKKTTEILKTTRDLLATEKKIQDLRKQLKAATSPGAQKAITSQLQTLRRNVATLSGNIATLRLDVSELHQKKLKVNRKLTDLHSEYATKQAWLDLNSNSRLGDLNTEMSNSLAYETATSSLQRLRDELAHWQSYNSNTLSPVRRHFEMNNPVDANGNITITLSNGEKVTRNWQELLDKYGIKHKKGGTLRRFDIGGPINNTLGTGDWFKHMYNTNAMKNWLGSFNSTNYLQFNDLQDSWWNNMQEAKYDASKPEKTGFYSEAVKTRQGIWNSLGLNEGIGNAHSANEMSGKGLDNAEGNYTDGWFGKLEYLRHGGTSTSWRGHEDELTNITEILKKNGLEYKPDANGVYKLNPIPAVSSPEPELTPDPLTPASAQKDGNRTISQPIMEEQPEVSTAKKNSFNFEQSDPSNKYALPRLMLANHFNDRITDLANLLARIIDLKDPFLKSRPIMSDLLAEADGHNAAGALLSLASRPQTADGNTQQAMELEAALKGQQFIIDGNRKSTERLRETSELARMDLLESAKNIHDVALENRASINDAARQLLINEQTRQSKKYTNLDTYLQERQFKAQLKWEDNRAMRDQFAKSDIHNSVTYDLGTYAPDLDPKALEVWNDVVSGAKQPSQLTTEELKLYRVAARAANMAEMDQLREYLKISPTRWAGVRQMSTEDPAWTPTLYLTQSAKNGAKIEVQKLRNRSKDNDRFHKNVQKNLDRNEKALDRVSKYRRRK